MKRRNIILWSLGTLLAIVEVVLEVQGLRSHVFMLYGICILTGIFIGSSQSVNRAWESMSGAFWGFVVAIIIAHVYVPLIDRIIYHPDAEMFIGIVPTFEIIKFLFIGLPALGLVKSLMKLADQLDNNPIGY